MWVTAEPFVLADWWFDHIIDQDPDLRELDYKTTSKKFEAMTQDEIIEQYGNNPLTYYEGPWDNSCDLRGRNYAWFIVLAGVRNYHQNINPIAEDRGLPVDVSPEVKRQSDQDGVDGHSHSWVTLRELLEYDWGSDSKSFHYSESMDKRLFLRFKTRKPGDYIGSLYDTDNMIEVSNYKMGQMCLGIYGLLDETKNYYTIVDWDESYREAIGTKYIQAILDKLAEYGDPDEVRLVFWFDN